MIDRSVMKGPPSLEAKAAMIEAKPDPNPRISDLVHNEIGTSVTIVPLLENSESSTRSSGIVE